MTIVGGRCSHQKYTSGKIYPARVPLYVSEFEFVNFILSCYIKASARSSESNLSAGATAAASKFHGAFYAI